MWSFTCRMVGRCDLEEEECDLEEEWVLDEECDLDEVCVLVRRGVRLEAV